MLRRVDEASVSRMARRVVGRPCHRHGLGARRALRRLEARVARGDQTVVDVLWDAWLDDPDDRLWTLLERAGRPAGLHRAARHPSLVALGHDSLRLSLPEHRRALLEAAERTDHPVGDMARRKLDELWLSWLVTADPTAWEVLDRWQRPTQLAGIHAVSLVALDQGDELSDPAVREALLETAGWVDHPISVVARRRLDEAWGRWLAEPDDRLADLLRTWGRPSPPGHSSHLASAVVLGPPTLFLSHPTHRHELVELARRVDHPIGDVACARVLAAEDQELVDQLCEHAQGEGAEALAAFCVEHQLAPAEPVRRAVFLLLTGQASRYRAADPAGSLLAVAYQAATDDDRRRLREAMVDAGDLDVMRVLVGSAAPDRPADLSPAEARFLATQLAERGAWSQLWDLVHELQLVDAAEVARSFDGGWQPATDTGRRLLAQLRTADGDLLVRLTDLADQFDGALLAYVRLRTRGGKLGEQVRRDDVLAEEFPQLSLRSAHLPIDTSGEVVSCAVSPDGRRVAVVFQPSLHPRRADVGIFDLLAGEWVELHQDVGDSWPAPGALGQRVLHLGGTVVACRWGGRDRTPQFSEAIVRVAAGGTEVVAEAKGCFATLVPTGDGFAALHTDAPFVHAAASEAHHVWFFTADGDLVRRVPLADLGMTRGFGSRADVMDVDPVSGRLALGGLDGLTILDPAADRIVDRWSSVDRKRTVVYWTSAVGRHGVWFAGPDRLVTADGDHELRSWSLRDGRLSPDHCAPVEPGWDRDGAFEGHELAFVAPSSRVPYSSLDWEPLTWTEGPRGAAYVRGRRLWGSPGGDLYVLGRGGEIEVVSGALVALADRIGDLVDLPLTDPLAETSPADDLAVVRAALRSPLLGETARPVVELLQAWLEHRFGAEVALGGATSQVAADPYGISLASGQEQHR